MIIPTLPRAEHLPRRHGDTEKKKWEFLTAHFRIRVYLAHQTQTGSRSVHFSTITELNFRIKDVLCRPAGAHIALATAPTLPALPLCGNRLQGGLTCGRA